MEDLEILCTYRNYHIDVKTRDFLRCGSILLTDRTDSQAVELAQQHGCTHVICHGSKIDLGMKNGVYVESFPPSFLRICIVKHTYVPKHSLVEEVPNRHHLSSILRMDPVVRYYGWTEGIVRVEREDGDVVYRRIV